MNLFFNFLGDSIDSSAVMILGIQISTEEKAYYLHLPNPLPIAMRSITDYIAEYFNKENYIVSWEKDIPFIDEHDSTLRIIPSDRQYEEFDQCDYYLARKSDN